MKANNGYCGNVNRACSTNNTVALREHRTASSHGYLYLILNRDVKLVFFHNRSSSRHAWLSAMHSHQRPRRRSRLAMMRQPLTSTHVRGHTLQNAATPDDGFIAGSKTIAVMNKCEAASALLSAKRSSRAARRSGLKSAMVGKSSAHSARSCVTSLVTSG